MTPARLIRSLVLAVVVMLLSSPLVMPRISTRRVSWGGACTLLGLVLDILGAVLLSWSLVIQPADEIAQAPGRYAWGRKLRVWRDPFLWLAVRVGCALLAGG